MVSTRKRKVWVVLEIILGLVAMPLLLAGVFWNYSVVLALAVAAGWALFVDDTLRHLMIAWRARDQRQISVILKPSTAYTSEPPQKIPPFALYLRGFARERTYLREEARYGMFQPHFSDLVTGRYLEKLLVRICKPNLALVGLANVSGEEHRSGIVWLSPGDREWQSEIKTLIECAQWVFLYLNNWTPGLREEISLLGAKPLQRKTIVLISPELEKVEREIRATLQQSRDSWAAVLEVPHKSFPWIVIILGLMVGIASWVMDSVTLAAATFLLFTARGAWNELRVARFVQQLKRALAD